MVRILPPCLNCWRIFRNVVGELSFVKHTAKLSSIIYNTMTPCNLVDGVSFSQELTGRMYAMFLHTVSD